MKERRERNEAPTLPLLQNTVIYIFKDESLATACRIIDNKKTFFRKTKKNRKTMDQQINMNNVDMMDILTDYHVSISTLYKISANAVILRKEH